MDTAAQRTLQTFVRRTITGDLDRLHAEVRALRYELTALRAATGMEPRQMSKTERQSQVLDLRGRGMSNEAIARTLFCNRATVERDLRELGAPAPPAVVGVDGRVRRTRPQAG